MDESKYEVSVGLERGTYNILCDGEIIFTTRFLGDGNIHISTKSEVYDGPIDLISFAPDKK